ncbi:MAG: DUF4870 domain-containing protein [Candidatus Hydrogenedentes bacterium]|nr:DUF4870 domain-containing protein [Candidatus Hydrogenedentota bacterium]
MADNELSQARTWAMATHLSTLCAYVGVPFGNIIAPLIIWMIKKDEFPFVDDQGKEALNFQISLTIYGIISAILCFILIGFVLLLALFIMHLVFAILAAVAANQGEYYRYPLTMRFIT